MMRPALLAALASTCLCASACDKKAASTDTKPTVDSDFACNKRHAEYTLKGSFAAPELGVILDCAERGPSITQWVLRDSQGNEKKDMRSLSSGQFDAAWKKIESSGWQQLQDCNNPSAKADDPVYVFAVSDHSSNAEFTCQGKKIPFPYDALAEELDELARIQFNR